MERRKDNKGRVLKEGESQRKDGLYQYRWTDKFGKRRTIYSGDLKELRVRIENLTESEIQGIDPIANSMTVKELVKKIFRSSQAVFKGDNNKEYRHFYENTFWVYFCQ